jgi:hypothetical protein
VTLFQGFLVAPPTTERLVRMDEIMLPPALLPPSAPATEMQAVPPLN